MGALTPAGGIDGVRIFPLAQIADGRGKVMHMMRADAPHFESFGEIYFSVIKAGAVKAWKRHRRMTQNFAVPVGEIRLVIYDDRDGSKTRGAVQEITTGAGNYALIRIPPMLWYGFTGTGPGDSLVANCASIAHDPAEAENIASDSTRVPYIWGK